MKPTYEELESLIAMQAEALKVAENFISWYRSGQSDLKIVREAISASAESVAAWEAEKLLPLQRQVAILRKLGNAVIEGLGTQYHTNGADDFYQINHSVVAPFGEALDDTQATAEAYDRERDEKVLKRLRKVFEEYESDEIFVQSVIDHIDIELRAQSAQKKEGE